jgi:hypothetical protein
MVIKYLIFTDRILTLLVSLYLFATVNHLTKNEGETEGNLQTS